MWRNSYAAPCVSEASRSRRVLNSAIRHGLTHKPKPMRFRQKTFRMGPAAPGVNLTKALQVAAELEDAEIIRKLKLGK